MKTALDDLAGSILGHDGFTGAEAEAWESLRCAARDCTQLIRDDTLHGMELEEVCHHFHDLQRWLLSRPMLRGLYSEQKVEVM